MKEISFKEYEPQEAKKRVFVSLKRLSKVFSEKEKERFLCISCHYDSRYSMNEISSIAWPYPCNASSI